MMIESTGKIGWGRTCADVSDSSGVIEFDKGSLLQLITTKRLQSNVIFANAISMYPDLNDILNAKLSDNHDFNRVALTLFLWQYEHNKVYQQYVNLIGVNPHKINHYAQIPCLPVEFFKEHKIVSGQFESACTFTSSRTSGQGYSTHYVKSIDDYLTTTELCFQPFLGDYRKYCHLALLPSYLEREGSSLIAMMQHFIDNSQYTQSGFYLNEFEELEKLLLTNEDDGIPTVLWGVTFALLDFAEVFQGKLSKTVIIETGGMKGRRKELTRAELYAVLKQKLGVSNIASEYGMTEMMSQCYSKAEGLFHCPPHVRVLGRELNDPFEIAEFGRNKAVNVIDLANVHSCAFLALSDLCNLHQDGSFEILGRVDMSEVRGCNLMVR